MKHWPVIVAEAVRDSYIHRVEDPDWHGGERAAQEIADLLRKFGAAAILWHTGSEVKSLTVLLSTLKRLRDLGLVELRGERGDMKDWGLSVTGELVGRIYDREGSTS